MQRTRLPSQSGFTLIELMITIAIIAILAAVAMPSYSAYVQRSRVPVGLDALAAYMTRMEQRYQDVGNYANGANCAVALPTAANFTVTCALTNGTQGFIATATGSGPLAGYAYTITHNGARATTAHPKGGAVANCWSTRGGGACDS
jgi:type IV pilus assembly protein PilE